MKTYDVEKKKNVTTGIMISGITTALLTNIIIIMFDKYGELSGKFGVLLFLKLSFVIMIATLISVLVSMFYKEEDKII